MTKTRREILARLAQIGELAPDYRFGQLVATMAALAAGPWDETLWDLEDEELLRALDRHLADLKQRTPHGAIA